MPCECKSFRRSRALAHPTASRLLKRPAPFAAAFAAAFVLAACGTTEPGPSANPDAGVTPAISTRLVINEVMTQNGGAWIDESGKLEDWIEVVNDETEPLALENFWIEDGSGTRVQLRGPTIEPGGRRILWADGDDAGRAGHLGFSLSSAGERLTISDADGQVIDSVELPSLGENEVFARYPDARGEWSRCRYASPGGANAALCTPPAPPTENGGVEFAPFAVEPSFPPPEQSLGVSELALRPESGEPYIELLNRSPEPVSLARFAVRVAPHAPDRPWPTNAEGEGIDLDAALTLAPGERAAVAVPASALAALEADPEFEGVLTLFERASGRAIDRVDFMSWPRGSTLMQAPESSASFRLCTNATPGAPNECTPLESRAVGERLRHLRTPGDYAALAAGEQQLGIQSVKFVVDLQAPGLVHLLSSARWPLHYTFVRERIYLEPPLDRCDPAQSQEFNAGWTEFSRLEYYRVEGRRFLLGTLARHASTGLDSVEYTSGDVISAEQMRAGFFAVLPHTDAPHEWSLRPQDDGQVQKARLIEGTLPIVAPDAPFVGITYQPLTEGVAYGTLRFVPVSELEATALGPDIIVVTDDVPNDIPFVGGLITEAFQTPLAHVNVLSQNRGTPNASLKDARTELAAYFDTLVRLEVGAGGVSVTEATPDEARDFWESRAPSGPLVAARLDTTLRGVQPLADHGIESLPSIGAKAAQLAELGEGRVPACGGLDRIETPRAPFAIPMAHFVEHFEASGARELLATLQTESDFIADSLARAAGLAAVRQRILEHPVDPALLAEVEAAVRVRFGDTRVRFRSSSNTEDLPGFNGAGLYTSISAELDDPERSVADAMRTVWASLYNARAYDERAYARIDDASVAMGILVHEAFRDERANGVAVSRNVLDPTRGDIYYVNAQAGEASVTNPAPGVVTEQLVYRWGRQPAIVYQSESSLLPALAGNRAQVLDDDEVFDLSCALRTVHDAFAPLLNPDGTNRWFAMEVEFKFYGPERRLLIKQARPQGFGRDAPFDDCREL